MLEIFSLGFPFSYLTLAISFLVGIGVTFITLGIVSAFIILFLSYTGILRIFPIYLFFQKIIQFFFSDILKSIEQSIQRTFMLEGSKKEKPSIYMFHPHGAFSASYFFHTQKYKWFGKGVISKYLWWIPFGWEVCEHLQYIPNRYSKMKEEVEKKENLSIIPGGALEMIEEFKGKSLEDKESGAKAPSPLGPGAKAPSPSGPGAKAPTLRVKILNRQGIFRLALETGTPLVPCLTFGEEELYSLYKLPSWIGNFLQKWEIILPLPSLTSLEKWITILKYGSKNPIKTVIGDSLLVEKNPSPTEKDILNMRKKYIEHLQEMYKKHKPEGYAEELEIL